MKINKLLIKKIADLSKLEFKKDSLEKITGDLNQILNFVNKLNEIDTDNIKPLIYVNEENQVLRDDEISNEITREDALKNASHKNSDYFKVPTVIKKDA